MTNNSLVSILIYPFIMEKTIILQINAPNSRSLHRRLKKTIKIIHSTKYLSVTIMALQQDRVHDRSSLVVDTNQSGLEAIDEGGIFIKSFTHNQMLAIKDTILADYYRDYTDYLAAQGLK